ncbi:MAG: hypothetical protein COA32_04660 [Fluviicola sp.]|nr:MAG: hypothetical protein COA32_04660 [Fluviicola sp.]
MIIQKISFRDQVKDLLIQEIIDGNILTGQKLSLVELSKKMGVSVTPVREALTQLQESGIITYKLNQGFYIKKINPTEAKDIYEVISYLEGLAIKQSVFTTQIITDLKELQKDLQRTMTPLERQKIDYKFHNTLIQGYSNENIKSVLENLKATVYIIELEYMKTDYVNISNTTHLNIIKLIENKKANEACKELQEHWKLSYDFLKKCEL